MSLLAVLLAAAGACCNAVSARLQHGGLRKETGGAGLRLGVLLRLGRQPAWLLGVVVGCTGAGLHAVALGLAPISVVQPIGVLAIALSAALSTRLERTRFGPIAGAAVAASMIGTVAFVSLTATTARATQVTPAAALQATVLVGVAVMILCAVGALVADHVRCLVFAAASGISFGYVSLLMRASIQQFADGDGIPWLPAAGILAGILIGGWLVQHAYASGRPEVVVGCLTVVDPLVAVGLGMALLGEGADTSVPTAVAEAACAALAVAGVVVFTRSRPGTGLPIGSAASSGRRLAVSTTGATRTTVTARQTVATQHYDRSTT
ncbi:MAG: hypothetical protein JOZ47_03045 [Kutzneria sp.]|nr:hypothetical protein [Kutzneria sp.]